MPDLFKKLTKRKHTNSPTALLLDLSASMDQKDYPRREDNNYEADSQVKTRLELLKAAVDDTPECKGLPIYGFNDDCYKVEDYRSLTSHGCTAMHKAFHCLKGDGYFNAIVVTDGQPDSEREALAAASGMRLGIIYVGPDPVPPFLQKLAAETEGTFAIADMTAGELPLAIAGMLEYQERKDDESNGPNTINL